MLAANNRFPARKHQTNKNPQQTFISQQLSEIVMKKQQPSQ